MTRRQVPREGGDPEYYGAPKPGSRLRGNRVVHLIGKAG